MARPEATCGIVQQCNSVDGAILHFAGFFRPTASARMRNELEYAVDLYHERP